MPSVLRQTEETLYPIKDVGKRIYDPYHYYYVLRKNLYYPQTKSIGILKEIEGKFYICWINSTNVTQVELARDEYGRNILTNLTEEFEVIELDNDEYSTSDGRGCDFDKELKITHSILKDLMNKVEMAIITEKKKED